jgi:hypothetical protein
MIKRPDCYANENWSDDETTSFATRIATPLKRPERVDAFFEARVMESARAEAAHLYQSRGGRARWWRRPMMLRVSPILGLAAAGLFAAIVSLGTLRMAPTARVAADTVHVVRFVFLDRNARSVEIVGDFNGWEKGATPLELSSSGGMWTASVPLPAGRHEYAFVVDGRRWVADPLAPKRMDEFEIESSVVIVGPESSRPTRPGHA